jgi:hypothetical protein
MARTQAQRIERTYRDGRFVVFKKMQWLAEKTDTQFLLLGRRGNSPVWSFAPTRDAFDTLRNADIADNFWPEDLPTPGRVSESPPSLSARSSSSASNSNGPSLSSSPRATLESPNFLDAVQDATAEPTSASQPAGQAPVALPLRLPTRPLDATILQAPISYSEQRPIGAARSSEAEDDFEAMRLLVKDLA